MSAISEISHNLGNLSLVDVPDVYDGKYPDSPRVIREKSHSPLKEEGVVVFEEDDENEEEEYYEEEDELYNDEDEDPYRWGYSDDEDEGDEMGYDYYDEI